MSLWFPLMVNDREVGRVAIRRITNTGAGTLNPDTVSIYEVTVDGNVTGTVDHRYGDGPWALLYAAAHLMERKGS